MKRFFVSLVILAVLAAVAFGFGYLPIRIEAGDQAVVFTKTNGWHPRLIRAGEFAWMWQLLIPTNATVHIIPNETRTLETIVTFELPSAQSYATMIDPNPRFAIEANMALTYRPAAEDIIRLVSQNHERGTDVAARMPELFLALDQSVSAVAREAIQKLLEQPQRTPALGWNELERYIHQALEDALPDADIVSVAVNNFELPDFELYAVARENFLLVQRARREVLVQSAAEQAANEARVEQRIQDLERYGQVLTDYPILVEYLTRTAAAGGDPLDLGRIESVPAAQ